MSGVILSSVIEIGMLLWLLAGIASLWVWGGARRGALGHLMAGAVLLVSGAIFAYVPRINAFARMDNSYLGNAWIGSILMLVGIILLIRLTRRLWFPGLADGAALSGEPPVECLQRVRTGAHAICRGSFTPVESQSHLAR